MIYFSHFFTSFFIGLRRICLRAKVHNLVFSPFLVGIDCVTDKILKATFSWMNKLFCPQIYSPEHWKLHFRVSNFKFSGLKLLQTHSPLPPLLEKGDQRPLVDTVGYSIQTYWLLQFLLKPWSLFLVQLSTTIKMDGITKEKVVHDYTHLRCGWMTVSYLSAPISETNHLSLWKYYKTWVVDQKYQLDLTVPKHSVSKEARKET